MSESVKANVWDLIVNTNDYSENFLKMGLITGVNGRTITVEYIDKTTEDIEISEDEKYIKIINTYRVSV